MNLKTLFPFIAAILLGAVALGIWKYAPQAVQHYRFETVGTVLGEDDFPWLLDMGPGQPFQAIIRVPGEALQIKVIPDDCVDVVLIDGVDFPIPAGVNRCDYTNGFTLDIPAGNYTRELSFQGHNNGGPGGFRVESAKDGGSRGAAPLLFGMAVVAFAFGFLRLRKWSLSLMAIALSGIALRLWYWLNTPWDIRTHDVGGHIHYVQLLMQKWLPPAPNECWQCYQPPVYYYPSAIFKSLVETLQFAFASNWELQLLSMIAGIGFLLAGISLLRRILPSNSVSMLFIMAFAFWPAAIIHSPRIGNDAFMYLFSALAFRSLYLWLNETASLRNAFLSSIFAALALASKTSGIVPVLVVLFGLASTYFPKLGLAPAQAMDKRFSTLRIALLTIGIVFLLVQTGPILRYVNGESQNLLVANAAGNGPEIIVKAEPGNFLWFDARSWIMHPYTNPWDDEKGRAWFLNYAGKTGLFGEFQMLQTPAGMWLASGVSLAALLLVFLVLRAMFQLRAKDSPWLLALVLSVLALAAMRLLYPLSCSNDARYILPAILPVTILAAKGFNLPVQNQILRGLMLGGVALFPLCSAALILALGL